MIRQDIIDDFNREVHDYFCHYLYHDESELDGWAEAMKELRHLLMHAYGHGVMDGLAEAMAEQPDGQIVARYVTLTEWPESEFVTDGAEEDEDTATTATQ